MHCKRCRLAGQGTVELIFTTIIFSVLLAFTANVSVYLYVVHSFTSAARHGARIAAMDTDLASADPAAAKDTIASEIQSFIQGTTGITIDSSAVQIIPPDAAQPVGARSVTVVIDYNLPLPLNVSGLIEAMGGSGEGLDSVPIHAGAVMHFEE